MRRTVLFQCLVPVVFASFIAAAAFGADSPAPAARASQETRKIAVANASAPSLCDALKGLFTKAKPLVSIYLDEGMKSLTVVGFADDVQQVESLVKQFDVPAPAANAPAAGPSQEIRKIAVKHTPVEWLGPGLQALFEEAKPLVKITAEKNTNSLTVVGAADDIEAVEKLVRQFDVAATQMEIEANVQETVTKEDGTQEVHLNPRHRQPVAGSDGATVDGPGMVLTVLNGSPSGEEMGEGGDLRIPGIASLPPSIVSSGRKLEVTAYESGGQILLVGVVKFMPESQRTTVANASGSAVVVHPLEAPFAVRMADPKTPCTIGPFESGPGRTIKVQLRAEVLDPMARGQADEKGKGWIPESGAAVGIQEPAAK